MYTVEKIYFEAGAGVNGKKRQPPPPISNLKGTIKVQYLT